MSTADIFGKALDPFVDCLTPAAAQEIVALRADPADQARLDELAQRANQGVLTPDERAEYEKFRAVFHMLTLLQSKARQRINSHQPG